MAAAYVHDEFGWVYLFKDAMQVLLKTVFTGNQIVALNSDEIHMFERKERAMLRPLRAALEKAKLKQLSFESIALYVCINPSFWLATEDSRDIDILLTNCIHRMPPKNFIDLLSHAIHHTKLSESLVINFVEHFISLNDWMSVRHLITNVALKKQNPFSARFFNHLLRLAKDRPDDFIFLYEILKTTQVKPNLITYSLLISWMSKNASVSQCQSVLPPREREKLQETYLRALKNFEDCLSLQEISEFLGAGGQLDTSTLNAVLQGMGRTNDAFKLADLMRKHGIAIDRPNLNTLLTSVASLEQLRMLPLENIDATCLFSSPLLRDSKTDLSLILNHLMSSGALYEEGLEKFLREHSSPADLALGVYLSELKPPKQSLLLERLLGPSTNDEIYELIIKGLSGADQLCKRIKLTKAYMKKSGKFNSHIVLGLLEDACRRGLIQDVIDMLTTLKSMPNASLPRNYISQLLRIFYDTGNLKGGRSFLALAKNEDLLSETSATFGTLLLGKAKSVINEARTSLPTSSEGLAAWLYGLIERRYYRLAQSMFARAQHNSPNLINEGHLGIALQASIWGHDFKLANGLWEKLQSQPITKLILSRMAGDIVKVSYSPEAEEMARGLLLYRLKTTGFDAFSSEYFLLFGELWPSSYESTRFYLNAMQEFVETAELKAHATVEWAESLCSSLGTTLKLDGRIFGALLRIARKAQSEALAGYCISQILNNGVTLNRTLYKLMIYFAPTKENAERTLSISSRCGIKADPEMHGLVVQRFLDDQKIGRACELIEDALRKGATIPAKIARDFLDRAYYEFPFTQYLRIASLLEKKNLFPSAERYFELIKAAMGRKDVATTRRYLRLLIRANYLNLCPFTEEILRFFIICGELHAGYRLFSHLRTRKSLPPGIASFYDVISRYLDPVVNKDIPFRLPRIVLLEQLPIGEMLDFSEKKGLPIERRWCQEAYENTLCRGDIKLARRLSLYMETKFGSCPNTKGIAEKIIRAWATHIKTSKNSEYFRCL